MPALSELSRREALLGLGAAVTAPILMKTGLATAQPRAEPINGSGFYKFNVGDIGVYSLGDGQAQLPSAFFAGSAKPEEISQLLAEYGLPADNVLAHFNVPLLKVGGDWWLVDTGNGGGSGQTAARLKSLGIKPEDIKGIVLTHVHGDHTGGLITDDKPTYTNAKVFINRKELEFWSGNADLSRSLAPAEMQQGLKQNAVQVLGLLQRARMLEVVDDKQVITTGLSVERTGGHTPGHMIAHVESGNQKLEIMADAFHHFILNVRRPDWQVAFDFDAAEGARVRRLILDRLASDKSLVMTYHSPFPGVGRILRRGESYEWAPRPWEW